MNERAGTYVQATTDFMRITTLKVKGLHNALGVARDLAKAHTWFVFEPLPDNEFLFCVKRGEANLFRLARDYGIDLMAGGEV